MPHRQETFAWDTGAPLGVWKTNRIHAAWFCFIEIETQLAGDANSIVHAVTGTAGTTRHGQRTGQPNDPNRIRLATE
jgi:hypothetical protein